MYMVVDWRKSMMKMKFQTQMTKWIEVRG